MCVVQGILSLRYLLLLVAQRVRLFATPWLQHARPPCPSLCPRVCSDSSTEAGMPSNYFILSCTVFFLLSIFPSIRVFSNESAIHIRCQSIRASASVLPRNIQGWFPLRFLLRLFWSPCFPWDSQESYPAPQFKSIHSSTLCLLYCPTHTSIHDYWKDNSLDYMDFSAALNMLANLENSTVATGLEKVRFHSNPKERQCQRMLKLPHNCTHLTR